MTFLSPLWLLVLIPFAGVALWLLIGHNPRVAVPFIELWNDSDAPKRHTSRALRRPPAAIACALLAMLLALLAATRPAFVRKAAAIPPTKPKVLSNLKIVRAAVRETPRASVMVRLRNDSGIGNAKLSVVSSSANTVRDIELPPRDAERDYFIDLQSLGDEVSVELLVNDDERSDNTVHLVRGGRPAKLEPRSTVSPELARMIDVYSKHRPATEASSRIAIVDDSARLLASESGVVAMAGIDRLSQSATVRVIDHPITAHVRDWNSITTDATIARRSPPDGWTPLVQAGDRVLVAMREAPSRQVWAAFSSSAFSRSTDFVIFWTDVFDWLGGSSGSEFRVDASRAPDVSFTELTAEAVGDESRVKLIELSRVLLLTALALLTMAAMLWKGDRSPKPRGITQDRPGSVAAKPLA